MNGDEVRIDPTQAAAGVQAWEAADSALEQGVRARLVTIRGLEGGAPWGADGPGAQFAADYPSVSEQVAEGVTEHATRLRDLGRSARTAIGASLASDAEQAAPVAQTEGQFSGAPAPGGGGGGGAQADLPAEQGDDTPRVSVQDALRGPSS